MRKKVPAATVVDRGQGVPLVVLPGLQGRWEYMRRMVEALSEHFRVIAFSLCGERGSGCRYDASKGLDCFAEQVDGVLDERGIHAAMMCGVSFGGLVALRYAASRPVRTRALVLASTPGPGWHLKRRHEVYARVPWLLGPLFLAETPWRLRRELQVALPDGADRRRFQREQLRTLVSAPVSLTRMAERARLIGRVDTTADCRLITAPTLVMTGEVELDHVIAADRAAAYGQLIRDARTVVVHRTGHLGCVTRPAEFAAHVRRFWAERQDADTALDGAPQSAGEAHDAA